MAVPLLLVAVIVRVYVPAVLGVPLKVAVPLPVLVHVSPATVPVWVRVGSGYPVALNWKVNAVPWTAVAELALVMTGGWRTVRVKDCVVVPSVFVAETVMA